MSDNDFYNNVDLVEDEDIINASKKPKKKKKMEMSSIKKGSNYEKVNINDEVNIEELLPEEETVEKQKEEFIVEYEVVEDKKEEEIKKPIYIGFTPRLLFVISLIPILSIISILLLYKSFTVDDIKNIRYTENSIINYKVYKDDLEQHSTTNVFNNDIDKILIDFSYQFKINSKSNLIFNNKILGHLLIVDKTKQDNILYQDDFILKDDVESQIKNLSKYNIRDNIEINYKEYNDKAKIYKTNYNTETLSYLNIELNVDYKNKYNNNYKLKDNSITSINIPLQVDNVEINKKELDIEKRVNKKPTISLKYPLLFGLGIITGFITILCLSKTLIFISTIMDQKSTYDKKVDKILKKYKRRIIFKDKVPYKRGKKTTNLKTINELVKISKKTKQPIEYCNINDHNKCQFSVVYQKELFILVIKAVDLEKKD